MRRPRITGPFAVLLAATAAAACGTADLPVPPSPASSPSAVSPSAVLRTAVSSSRPVPAEASAALDQGLQRYVLGAATGTPAARTVELTGYEVSAWESADHFTLLVTFVVRAPSGDAGPFNPGSNDRFVQFDRPTGRTAYELTWSTAP